MLFEAKANDSPVAPPKPVVAGLVDPLPKYLLTAFVAYKLRVPFSTATQKVEQTLGGEGPGGFWDHLADYVTKLQAGYLPLDLRNMVKPFEGEEPGLRQ
jgi:hypothetical protein